MTLQQMPKPQNTPKRVTILGSTGSIGCNTVELLAASPEAYDVVALTANSNVSLLAAQARQLGARLAVVADPERYGELKAALAGTDVEVAAGKEALVDAATRPADWMMAAIVGAAGLAPTLAAIRCGGIVGLANKECLVCAGDLMLAEISKSGATLLPVDSEHNAIFQVLDMEHIEAVEKITLTASGGPFRKFSYKAMSEVTPEQAVAHPNWDMGAKISVDSATMMNKGLELIEAFYLFPVKKDQIDILVHPQSVIHSMVSYTDGSVLAQLGMPDMRTPIAYALGWPERISAPSPRLDLAAIGQLTFEVPDSDRFPALRLARQSLQSGGGAPTILNAANEVAVAGFLAGKIGFLEIARIVEETLEHMAAPELHTLEDVFEMDASARRHASGLI